MVELSFKCTKASHYLLELLLNARKALFQLHRLGNILDQRGRQRGGTTPPVIHAAASLVCGR